MYQLGGHVRERRNRSAFAHLRRFLGDAEHGGLLGVQESNRSISSRRKLHLKLIEQAKIPERVVR